MTMFGNRSFDLILSYLKTLKLNSIHFLTFKTGTLYNKCINKKTNL